MALDLDTREISLCNQALIKLGAKMINSTTDSPTGLLCEELFQFALDTFSTQYRWTWNEVVDEVSAEVDPSPEPVFYSYVIPLPADFLLKREILDPDTHLDITDYDVRGKKIYCNYDKIILRYAAQIDATNVLPYTVDDAFTSYLAHRLAPALENQEKAEYMFQEAMQKGTQAYMEDASQRKSPLDNNYHPEGR